MLKAINRLISNTIRLTIEKDIILVKWSIGNNNWGDSLNPILINKITGKKPVLANHIVNWKKYPVYSIVGSILDWSIDLNTIVWGSGFISANSIPSGNPKNICAVRGPLTKKIFEKNNIKCPKIFGDPALLYPKYYKPKVEKKYKLGLIPHYVDQKHPFFQKFTSDKDILIIDILGETNAVIDQICSCNCIASTSLHGIIASDAYGIPSSWIELSQNIIGGRFKFYDYYLSVGKNDQKPLIISDKTKLKDIFENIDYSRININLDELVDACPLPELEILTHKVN